MFIPKASRKKRAGGNGCAGSMSKASSLASVVIASEGLESRLAGIRNACTSLLQAGQAAKCSCASRGKGRAGFRSHSLRFRTRSRHFIVVLRGLQDSAESLVSAVGFLLYGACG